MKKFIKKINIGFIALALVLLCSISYAEQNENKNANFKLSELQITLLANQILKNTPEYIHFSKETMFSWVLLSQKIQKNTQSLVEEVIRQLKKKYTVYLEKEEIPEGLLEKDENGNLIGYKDGFSFSFIIEFEGKEGVKVYYSDWEGNQAASSHWKRYKWTGKDWQIIGKSGLLVS